MSDDWADLIENELALIQEHARTTADTALRQRSVHMVQRLREQLSGYAKSSDMVEKFVLKSEECRVIGESCITEDARAAYEQMALAYERLADLAQRSCKGRPTAASGGGE
jgi:hypothetical protein